MAPNRARRIFPTTPSLADIFGRTDLNFEKFYFFDFLDPTFPDAAAASAATGFGGPGPGPRQGAGQESGPSPGPGPA